MSNNKLEDEQKQLRNGMVSNMRQEIMLTITKKVVIFGTLTVLADLVFPDITHSLLFAALAIQSEWLIKKVIDVFTIGKIFDNLNVTLVSKDNTEKQIKEIVKVASELKDEEDK